MVVELPVFPFTTVIEVALVLLVILTVATLLVHYIRVRRLIGKKLEQFITCDGRERWGSHDLVARWRSQALHHLARELTGIQHRIWQTRHKIQNLHELKGESVKKLAELGQPPGTTNDREGTTSEPFREFETRQMQSKIVDINGKINRTERMLQVMRQKMIEKKDCIDAYKNGKNPRLKLSRRIRGTFLFLK